MAPLAGLIPSRTWLLAAAPVLLAGCGALTGCDDKVSADNAKVKISGQTFYLETAMDDTKRFRGLSERTHIEENGGMLFVFSQPRPPSLGGFVMRDCPVPIDILYLDRSGRVVTSYAMTPEPPRGPGEGKPGQKASDRPTPEDAKYNDRLKQYVSRHPYQFVVELKGGRLKDLNVKDGDIVEFDREELLKKAR